MINPCEVNEVNGTIHTICSQGTKDCEIYHYDPDHIKADDIAEALKDILDFVNKLADDVKPLDPSETIDD